MLKDLPDDPNDPIVQELKSQLKEQVPDRGAIIGWAIGTIHKPGAEHDAFIAPPGTKIGLVFPKAGNKPEASYDDYTVVGYFKSGMSEYDSQHVYIPLERMQDMRLLRDEQGRGAVNTIQIKTKPGVDIDALRDRVQTALEELRPMTFRVATWEQKQGAFLSAVAIEQSILNMLLFFIIAVAGFGILAIFFMIVVEKTRDIGIMKALGASTAGVRGIFLGYGLLLGMVGSGVGMAGGLLFVATSTRSRTKLSKVLGHKVFDDTVYYFSEIPTLRRSAAPWRGSSPARCSSPSARASGRRKARPRCIRSEALRFE